MRGINVIQVPTTVLAMVDASIGGKTGFNVPSGKNLIGSFHQPIAVVCWLKSLNTLSDREYRSGLAEVVKSALLQSEDALAQLETDAALLVERNAEALERAIQMASDCKLGIVQADLREKGQRAWLNLGHTFAHAIEHASGYGSWTHGEAVAAGLMLACRYAVGAELLAAEVLHRVDALLKQLQLPTVPPPLSGDAWITPMRLDKKRSGNTQRLILLRNVGEPLIQNVEYETLERWLLATAQAPTLSAHFERRLL